MFFTEPSATDNSGTAILVSRSAEPGDFFTRGPTVVTYTFGDGSGNQDSCNFQILVVGGRLVRYPFGFTDQLDY